MVVLTGQISNEVSNVPQIPNVDLRQDDATVAQEIRHACTKFGFFTVTGHGVDKKLIDDVFAINRRLFDLPMDEKLKYPLDENVRGYAPMEDEHLDDTASKQDTKEGYYISREMPAGDPRPLIGPNQWPSEELLPGYKALTEAYIEQGIQLALRLVELIALSLELPRDFFNQHFLPPKLPMYFLKPLHYFNTASSEADKLYACGAHTDFGMLTLLKTGNVNGLQVKVEEKWIPLDPPEDAYVINLGDMAQRWTNGLYKSTWHRVMTDGRDRYSLPLFFDPDFYTPVECVPSSLCQSPENPPKFTQVKSGEYVLGRYAESHNSYKAKES